MLPAFLLGGDFVDKVEICNIALNHIGVETIERLDEASEAARVCSRFYDYTRRAVLRKFTWAFAAKMIKLALVAETPPNWRFAYMYPSDALCLRNMHSENFQGLSRENQYKIVSFDGNKVIYTNIDKAWIEYTADIIDSDLWDSQFVEAFTWKLASEIAFSLTTKTDLVEMCLQAYNAYFIEASASDAGEENLLDPHLDRLAMARFEGA